MRVFLAGAGGAIGHRLVPQLVEQGHHVIATTRTPAKADDLAALGAEPAVVDVLDRNAVIDAVGAAKPHVIIHQATALAGSFDLKHFERYFAQTNRLRAIGTDNLLEAARAAGTPRMIAQSYTGWPNARTGSQVKTEADPLDPAAPPVARETLDAILHLESAVTGASHLTGVALRYGSFYGPRHLARGRRGDHDPRAQTPASDRRRRWRSLVVPAYRRRGRGHRGGARPRRGGHLQHRGRRSGARVSLAGELAEVLGAKPPRRVPAWLARPMIGTLGVVMMTSARGSSNEKAKRELGRRPAYPSWREGFRRGLG